MSAIITTRSTLAIQSRQYVAGRQFRYAASLAVALLAGSVISSAQSMSAGYAAETPRVEIFGGYSYLYPNTVTSGLLPSGILPVSSCLCAMTKGAGASITIPITRWVGGTIDASGHWDGKSGTPAQRAGNGDAYNIAAGPQFLLRTRHITPFAEVLFGVDRLSPSEFHQDTAFGLIAGGGLDIPVAHHISVRPVQADFVYSNHRFGPSPTVPASNLRGLRIQAGVVFSFGGKAAFAAPAALAPAMVAPIAAPAPVIAAPVDVVTLAATAVPAQINAGESSTIAANGVSSLGRPLTFTYAANEGTIAANGSTALLTTAGLGAGTALVTVHVVDDLGHGATQTVPVLLTAVVVPVIPFNDLGAILFGRDLRRPTRIDNEAKAFLDHVTLALQHDSGATVDLIGYAAKSERDGVAVASLRAIHAKAYLVEDKGIDPSRISLYTGQDDSKRVEVIMIPAGVVYDTYGLVRVNEKERRQNN